MLIEKRTTIDALVLRYRIYAMQLRKHRKQTFSLYAVESGNVNVMTTSYTVTVLSAQNVVIKVQTTLALHVRINFVSGAAQEWTVIQMAEYDLISKTALLKHLDMAMDCKDCPRNTDKELYKCVHNPTSERCSCSDIAHICNN